MLGVGVGVRTTARVRGRALLEEAELDDSALERRLERGLVQPVPLEESVGRLQAGLVTLAVVGEA